MNRLTLTFILTLVFFALASGPGIQASANFVSKLIMRCNTNQCWKSLGLVMNTVIFFVIVYFVVLRNSHEGYVCDMGDLSEDGRTDGCTLEQRDARQLFSSVTQEQDDDGKIRIIRGRRTNALGEFVNRDGIVIEPQPHSLPKLPQDHRGEVDAVAVAAYEETVPCTTVDDRGFGTPEENNNCKSAGLSPEEEYNLTNCAFNLQPSLETCHQWNTDFIAKNAANELTDEDWAKFQLCMPGAPLAGCKSFNYPCQQSFGEGSECIQSSADSTLCQCS